MGFHGGLAFAASTESEDNGYKKDGQEGAILELPKDDKD